MPSVRPGPPLILWRFLSLDLSRRLLLSGAVFVCITAFAAAVKPLADGVLGAADTLRFMGLAVVPMLQFALPFAAGFAATLVYHDFASDNEAAAASVGGVSYRSLLVPALAIGALLAVALAALTDQVIPRFFQRMERLVAQDVTRLLVSSISKGRPVTIGELTIAADQVYQAQSRAESGADHLILLGLVAVAAEGDGALKVDVAARRADIWLTEGVERGEPATLIVMRVEGAHGRQVGAGLVDLREGADIGPWAIPNPVRDRLNFRTLAGLRDLRLHPDRRPDVDRQRRRLAGLLALDRAEADLARTLAHTGRLSLESTSGQRVEVVAAALERAGDSRHAWRLVPSRPDGMIEASWPGADALPRRQAAQRATLALRADERTGRTLADLNFEMVGPLDADGARRESIAREGLTLPGDPAPPLFDLPSPDLLAVADAHAAPDPSPSSIPDAAALLRRRIARLHNEITGELHERAARSAAALLMTLVGAVLALRLKDSLPLTVYLWSFFPALLTIVTISGGASATKDNAPLGVLLIWSGVAALGAFTLWEYARLRRH